MIQHRRSCPMNEQAAAAVLHALDPDQELSVRTHLAGCLSCRGAARDAELVAHALAESVEQVEPPVELRSVILTMAAQHRHLSATTTIPRIPPPGPKAKGRRRWDRIPRRAVAAAVAALVVVAALAGYSADLRYQRDTELARVQALTALMTQVGLPGARAATLRAPDGQPVGVVLASATQQTLVVSALTTNDASRSTYVVWGIGTTTPRPIATFDVADANPGLHTLTAPPAQPFLGYAISLEPGRRAPAGPTDVVATGHLVT